MKTRSDKRRPIDWGSPTSPFVSYAQNFEDVLLKRIFKDTSTGFYIDLGAFHPVIGSVTKAFYDRGWSGINVEPGKIFQTLAAARRRDINLEMAVSDYTGEVAFLENTIDPGMSRVLRDNVPLSGDEALQLRIVPCDTLQSIVNAYAGGRLIDFLKIDTEGSERAIVLSTDWSHLRPRVLVLESTLPWTNILNNHEWEPILLRQGYVFVYFDGINSFYVREEDTSLAHHFRIPVNVLDWSVQHHSRASRCNHHRRVTIRSDSIESQKLK